MNDKSVTHDDENRHGGRSADRTACDSSDLGITDEDMARIRSFLAKQRHDRTVDDLRPSTEQ
ncbi:hypothetical protein [Halobacterium jilantaiense]|uniref:hypothetical protein n=1 Tax=Halobacterium jilantaiense TaxID=355548 RepID=UPI000B7E27F9|nr:hypothetical protein [Halobacterium jilantaiense]